MKKTLATLALVGLGLFNSQITKSQTDSTRQNNPNLYLTYGGDVGIVSFADIKENGEEVRNLPRLSVFSHWFFVSNVGLNTNYDFGKNIGFFAGVNHRNLGFKMRKDDEKKKYRVNTVGLSAGLKLGDLKKKTNVFFGGEYDWAYHYKEKSYLENNKKFREWSSNRTPLLMPSVFAGIQLGHFGVKAQYFPNNFFNQDYTSKDGTKPYKDLDAKIFFVALTAGF